MLVKYVSIDGIPQVFLSFRFVDLIVITVNFSVLISSCNFDVENNSLCVYVHVRYEYTE
jgi:hypothetical protein